MTREKSNKSLEIANILNENKHKRLSVLEISAIWNNMETEQIDKIKSDEAKKKILDYTKTFITHARMIIEEDWGGFLLPKKINKVLKYKIATEEDLEDIKQQIIRYNTLGVRANNRFTLRLGNLKKLGLLTEKEKEKLLINSSNLN